MLGSKNMVRLLRELVSDDARVRNLAADSVTDVTPGLREIEAQVLAHVLVCLADLEQDPDAQEAQFNALGYLDEKGRLPESAIAEVANLDPAKIAPVAREAYEYLRSLG